MGKPKSKGRKDKKFYGKRQMKPYQKKNTSKNKSSGTEVAKKGKSNFRFIQRGQQSMEYLHRQKLAAERNRVDTERKATYEARLMTKYIDTEEIKTPYEEFLATLPKSKRDRAYESSSDDEDDEEAEEMAEEEQTNEDEMAEEIDMGEEEEDDEDDETIAEDDISSTGNDEAVANDEAKLAHLDEDFIGEEEPESLSELETDTEDAVDAKSDGKMSAKESKFSQHLKSALAPAHVQNLLAKPMECKTAVLEWPTLGTLEVSMPKLEQNAATGARKPLLLDEEDERVATQGTEPSHMPHVNLQEAGVSSHLRRALGNQKPLFTPLQAELFAILNNYQDLHYAHETFENMEELRYVYVLHALNHMLKTRASILLHNSKLAAAAANKKKNKKKEKEQSSSAMPATADNYRDQGLVRPKILLLLPFRSAALKVVSTMARILFGEERGEKANKCIAHYARFQEEYGGDTIYFPKTKRKPEDYMQLFAGNTDDNFRIGLSLTKKTLKLYTEFYASDIIIASPLGLRTIIGAAGDAERDFDFLNSIELLIMDQADMFLAQNWEHVLHIFEHLHLQPLKLHDTDLTRVRSWCLDGLSRFYRQTLIFAPHHIAELQALSSNLCRNYQGSVLVSNFIELGSIHGALTPLPHIFLRIDVASYADSFDARFNYMIREVLPKFKSPFMSHCLIYVPSYFDYVRLRNYAKRESLSFVQICEYTKEEKIARARDMFYHSAAPILLYSERSHFFRRNHIKGIRHLVVYQPPLWPHLYPELVNLMLTGNQNMRDGLADSMSITVLYTKYDGYQLNGILGNERTAELMESKQSRHVIQVR